MQRIRNLFQLFFAVLMVHICAANLYSEQGKFDSPFATEDDFELLENPFRMQKINVIWQDAKKRLPTTRLADLFIDLDNLDQNEAHMKRMRAETETGADMEDKILINFQDIIEKHGLHGRFPQDDDDDDYVDNEIHRKIVDEKTKSIQFQDPKLQNIWLKVEQARFSEEDLNMLKEEFWNQQMRIHDYNFINKEKDETADTNDNSIEFEQKKTGLPTNEDKERKASLKKDEKEIREGYLRLEHLVAALPGAEPAFRDHRVKALWKAAKEANWNNEELNEFKDELMHFEHRLRKQVFHKKHLDLLAETEVKQGDELWEEHQRLEEENKYLDQKIEQLHGELMDKVDAALRHSEL